MRPASKSRARVQTATPKVKARRKRRWLRYLVAAFAGPLILIVSVLAYYYVTLSRVIGATRRFAAPIRPAVVPPAWLSRLFGGRPAAPARRVVVTRDG